MPVADRLAALETELRRLGRVVVAMPGPPREMRPMWAEHVLPRLRERGLGRPGCVRTYRLTGIAGQRAKPLARCSTLWTVRA